MAKYVLAADYTLMTDYRNVPLATFFSCIPTDYWHSRLVFRILADPPKLDPEGRPIRVPYGLRKVEASLVRAYGRDAVVIADPRNIDRYIDDETEVVGLSPMDPLGLGPVSMSFTMGGVLTPFTKAMFFDLVRRVQRPNRKYKVVLGGPGAWHFDYRPEMQASLGIDHIVHGEVDHLVPEIFDRIVNDHAPPVMRFTNATAPTVDQIPKILGPTMHAMNEGMRPWLRVLRSHPAPAPVFPVRLHRRRNRDEHQGRGIVDPTPLGRHLPVQPRELENDGAKRGRSQGPLPVRHGPTRRLSLLPHARDRQRRGHEPGAHPGHLGHRARGPRQVGRHPERNRDGEPRTLPGRAAPEGRSVHRRRMAGPRRAGHADSKPQLLVSCLHDHPRPAG